MKEVKKPVEFIKTLPGYEYLTLKDAYGNFYVNLTMNPVIVASNLPTQSFGDIVLPQSGHACYLENGKILGFPPVNLRRKDTSTTGNIFFLVEYSVWSKLQADANPRLDEFCYSLRGEFYNDGIGLNIDTKVLLRSKR